MSDVLGGARVVGSGRERLACEDERPFRPGVAAGGVAPVDAKHERELRGGELGERTLDVGERLALAQHLERADRLARRARSES